MSDYSTTIAKAASRARGDIVNIKFLRMVAESAGDEDEARTIFSAADELDRLAAENEALQAEVERLRLQLAACGVVALANTPESAARQRDMHPDYMSASCQDVIAAVDREMALQAELERYSMSAGAADQFRREALAMREALGFDKYGDDIAPVDLLNALAQRDAEVIRRVIDVLAQDGFNTAHGDYVLVSDLWEYVDNQLRQQAKDVQS